MNNFIRNFAIIAHVDHGKSTLADRLLELTKTIPPDKMRPQYLDQMPLERERGVTIKLAPVTMLYEPQTNAERTQTNADIQRKSALAPLDNFISNGVNQRQSAQVEQYVLNLIDTPGHIDFNYEVSRSLAAVEGVILLVDASQGIQAQTVTNLRLALEQKLVIIPVLNKIDLPGVDLEIRKKELADLLNVSEEEIILISAKTGQGVEKILEAVVKKVPSPKGNSEAPLRALIFDSIYSEHKGVVVYLRVVDGEIKTGDQLEIMGTKTKIEAQEVGIFKPMLVKKEILTNGSIGYSVTGLKDIKKCRVGDTIVDADKRGSKRGSTQIENADKRGPKTQIDADQNADQRGLLYEELTYEIRGLLFNVYNKLGPAHKENIYSNALEEELKKNNITYEREKIIDVIYDNKKVGIYRPDFIIEGKVILEIKAQPFTGELEIKQSWHYLKGSHYRLALLVNFGARELQIKRIVYDAIRDNPRSNPRESAMPKPLPGYRQVKPMVFSSLYNKKSEEARKLGEAMGKLQLNDASLFFEPEKSNALGFGFRCGFLGLFHLEIIKERLKREYNLEIIATRPSVAYHVWLKGQPVRLRSSTVLSSLPKGSGLTPRQARDQEEYQEIRSPENFPSGNLEKVEEPIMKVEIISPQKYLGNIIELIKKYHGQFQEQNYLTSHSSLETFSSLIIKAKIPLSMMIIDFYDKLKNVSAGYASMSYEFAGYEQRDLVRLDILVAGDRQEAFSTIVYREDAYHEGRRMAEFLKNNLPRQMFEVKIQAVTGWSPQRGEPRLAKRGGDNKSTGHEASGKIIASERLPAMRKDVTAKLYGGDVTRKMKLLRKQKKGKKKMMFIGKVDVPSDIYIKMLKR